MKARWAGFALVFLAWLATGRAQELPPPGCFTLEGGGLRIEGDQYSPNIGPHFALAFGYDVNPFFGIFLRGAFGYAGGVVKGVNWRHTLFAPVGAEMRLLFWPLRRVTPFVTAGGGLFYWDAQDSTGETINIDNNEYGGFNAYAETGGGFLYASGRNTTFHVGFRYGYTFTDRLDVRGIGNEYDQVVTIYAGVSFRFGNRFADDWDNDGVPASLDLDPNTPEDPDGFLDHDGIPESGPPKVRTLGPPDPVEIDTLPPVIIHHPVRVSEAGHSVKVKALVEENSQLKLAALLYRRMGMQKWNVKRMRPLEANFYEELIPGFDVVPPSVEYCVVAVDEALSGVGYSGLPGRPNLIRIVEHGPGWRLLGGTLAAMGWSAAGLLVLHRQ